MKENIRIINVFTIACFLIGVNSNQHNNEVLDQKRGTTPTNLDLFIKDISTLTSLTKGIIFQTKLADHFEMKTSEYFQSKKKSFIGFLKSRPDWITSAITDFHERAQQLKFKSKFDGILQPLSFFESLADASLTQLVNSTNVTLIDELSHILETIQKDIPDLEPPTFDFLLNAEKCILPKENLSEVEDCYREMERIDRENITKEFQRARIKMDGLHLIKKFIASFRYIEQLQTVVQVSILFSKQSQLVESIPITLKTLNEELKASKLILKGKKKSIAKQMERALYGSEITTDLDVQQQKFQFFEALNSTWLQMILGENKMNKLKTGFEPTIKYSESIEQIEQVIKELKNLEMIVYMMKSRMEKIEKWKSFKKFSLSNSLIDTIETCTENLPKLKSSINFYKFASRFGYTRRLISSLESYIGVMEELIEMENKILNGIDILKTKMNEWKSENWHKKQSNLINLSKGNNTKGVDKIHSSAVLFLRVKFQFFRLESISDHEISDDFKEVIGKIKTPRIISIAQCFSERNFAHGKTVVFLNAVSQLEMFGRISKSDLNPIKKYMNGVSRILSILKSAKNATKKGLSSETMYLNGFEQKEEVHNTLESGLNVMKTMSNVQKKHALLQKVLDSNFQSSDDFWKNWTTEGRNKTMKTIEEVKKLDMFIGGSRNKSLSNVGSVFKEATKIPGLIVFDGFNEFKQHVKNVKEAEEVVESFENMKYLDLDFTHHTKELQSAADSIGVLETFFNGFIQSPPEILRNETLKAIKSKETFWRFKPIPWFQIVFLLLGAISLIVTSSVIICSLTPYGRKRWKQIYLERFAPEDVLELHWRYSYWLDQESDKNALCEAVREVNFEQVKSLINKGVFINVYNSFGNTPLHAAAKYGHVKIVELLIKNGADRKAFNYENKTPEQLLSESVEMTTRMTSVTSVTSISEGMKKSQMTEKEKFSEIEKIFERDQGKIFRQRVPDLLPTMSYRIRIDTRLTDDSYDAFLEVYKGNVTDQLSGVTHFIVPTDKNGIFVSDDFGYIMCVFLPTLLMQKQWMSACLEKKSNFRNDYKFRVERVKYKGVAHDTVLKWSQWIHKQKLPFLFGVHIHVAVRGMAETEKIQLKQLVEMHGATWCDDIQNKENYNIGSHPYHHFNIGPLFIIHDGKKNLDHLKNDVDKMYTLMTFDQFVGFMLKLECHYDPERKVPIPVTTILDKSE